MRQNEQVLFAHEEIDRTTTRMAHEVLEWGIAPEELLLVGIQTRGVHLGRRIADKIGDLTGRMPLLAAIDVTPFRDDQRRPPDPDTLSAVSSTVSVSDKSVVLIDDVIYTGRTIRAALDMLSRWGVPRKILVATLVDRGDRELPIRADVVGKNVKVSAVERVNVRLMESDGVDEITVAARLPQGGAHLS